MRANQVHIQYVELNNRVSTAKKKKKAEKYEQIEELHQVWKQTSVFLVVIR